MSDPAEEYNAQLRRRVQRARKSPWRRFKRRWRRRYRRHRVLAIVTAIALVVAAIVGTMWLVWDHETSTASNGTHPTGLPTAEDTSRLGGGVTIASARELIASDKPLVLSVLGDSTGNGPDEWVFLWAQHLAATRAVTYHMWDDVNLRYSAPQVLSTDGPKTDIWNGSAPGRTAVYPTTHLRAMQPNQPDLVIYNFGHNNTAENFDEQLYATLTAVEKRWGMDVPSLAILQNPENGATADKHEQTVHELRSTIAPAFGLDTIDVWSAFEDDGRPLTTLITNIDGLGVHPSPEGSRVWVDAVIAALG